LKGHGFSRAQMLEKKRAASALEDIFAMLTLHRLSSEFCAYHHEGAYIFSRDSNLLVPINT